MDSTCKMLTTPLMEAVIKRAPLSNIIKLLNDGHDPDEVHHNGATVLHIIVARAALSKSKSEYYLAVLDLLLSKVTNISPKNDFKQTPLQLGLMVDVPVDLMTDFVLLWSQRSLFGTIWFYLNECPSTCVSVEQLTSMVVNGGCIYPTGCCGDLHSRVSLDILTNVLAIDHSSAVKCLRILLKAGLDLTGVEQIPNGMQEFVNSLFTGCHKKSNLPQILVDIWTCGGATVLKQLCDVNITKKHLIPLHGMPKLRMAMYKSVNQCVQQPLKLQDQAAHAVRRRLKPNAVVGLPKLKTLQTNNHFVEVPSVIRDIISLNY